MMHGAAPIAERTNRSSRSRSRARSWERRLQRRLERVTETHGLSAAIGAGVVRDGWRFALSERDATWWVDSLPRAVREERRLNDEGAPVVIGRRYTSGYIRELLALADDRARLTVPSVPASVRYL